MTGGKPIRVLVADDHPVFLHGLTGVLAEAPDMVLVGEVADGDQAVVQALKAEPDVVLMDLKMAGCGGVEATRQLTEKLPGTAVLVLTMFDDDESLHAALRAGARGYLVKGTSGEFILAGIRAVAEGSAVFGSDVASRVLGRLTSDPRIRRTGPFPELTDCEIEILDLLAAGRTNAEIARELVVSAKTVTNHITNVFAKLGVTDRAQAIIRGRDAGLGR